MITMTIWMLTFCNGFVFIRCFAKVFASILYCCAFETRLHGDIQNFSVLTMSFVINFFFFYFSVNQKKKYALFECTLFGQQLVFFPFFLIWISEIICEQYFSWEMFFLSNVFQTLSKRYHKDLFVIMVWNVITKHIVAALYLFFCSSFLKRNKPEAMALCFILKYRVIALDYIKTVALIFIIQQKISRKFLIL